MHQDRTSVLGINLVNLVNFSCFRMQSEAKPIAKVRPGVLVLDVEYANMCSDEHSIIDVGGSFFRYKFSLRFVLNSLRIISWEASCSTCGQVRPHRCLLCTMWSPVLLQDRSEQCRGAFASGVGLYRHRHIDTKTSIRCLRNTSDDAISRRLASICARISLAASVMVTVATSIQPASNSSVTVEGDRVRDLGSPAILTERSQLGELEE